MKSITDHWVALEDVESSEEEEDEDSSAETGEESSSCEEEGADGLRPQSVGQLLLNQYNGIQYNIFLCFLILSYHNAGQLYLSSLWGGWDICTEQEMEKKQEKESEI